MANPISWMIDMTSTRRKYIIPLLLGVLLIGGWTVYHRLQGQSPAGGKRGGTQAVPVEVAPIERGTIELRRTFSGTLEATARFVVAPKITGRIQQLTVDFADPVEQGQVVAVLDNDEYVQAVAQAEADMAVARANRTEAQSALEIATREGQRVETLRKRGVASESQLDTARADQLAKRARLAVADAQVTRAEAALETAKIRLGYTQVTAQWTGPGIMRVVAERFVDEGDTVSANTPLLSIVSLDPITGVIFVTEKDYARLRPGQPVILTTDAYTGEQFPGKIARIAPVFRQAVRQARVDLTIDNPQSRLKPGMFIRAAVVLDRVTDATIVPAPALTTRNDETGVFVVSADGNSVAWRPVTPGIREDQRVQVDGESLTGRVVTLGQQLVDDGSAITIPANATDTGSHRKAAEK